MLGRAGVAVCGDWGGAVSEAERQGLAGHHAGGGGDGAVVEIEHEGVAAGQHVEWRDAFQPGAGAVQPHPCLPHGCGKRCGGEVGSGCGGAVPGRFTEEGVAETDGLQLDYAVGAGHHCHRHGQASPSQAGPAAAYEVRQGDVQAMGAAFDALACRADEGGEVGHCACGAVEASAPGEEEVGEGELEALGAVVEALAGGADECGEVWEAAFGAAEAEAALLRHAVKAAGEAGGFLGKVRGKFGAHGDGHLGGGSGGGGAAVGGEVDEGMVGLVADRGDEGDAAGGCGADDGFVVEGHEVFEAAAAACNDEDVGAGNGAAGFDGVEALDGGGDARGGGLALDGDRPKQDGAGEAAGDGGADVVQDGARG